MGNRAAQTAIKVSLDTVTGKEIDTTNRLDGYAITWDEPNDRYEHSEVLTAASVTYEQLDSVGDVGTGAGQLLPGDYRFDIEELNLVTDGTTSHIVTLADHYAHAVSPYMANDPVITDNGDGTISISAAEAYMKMGNFGHSPLKVVTVPAIASIAIPLDQNYIVYTDYNGGSPTYAAMASVAGYFYVNWDKLPFATVINIGSKIIVNDFSDAPIDGLYKNILGQLNYQPIRYLGGLGSVEVGTRQVSVSGGAVLLGNEYKGIAPLDTSTGGTFTQMYVTGGTWTRTTGQTTVSNVQYNNTVTGLVTASALPERWINKWLYYIIDSPNFWILVEGQTLYTSLAAAEAGGIPSVLPPEASQFYAGSLLVAKIIVSTNQTNFVEIQNPFVQTFQTIAASNHDNLSNINLAGTGVTYGHVTASAQTIAGAKTFSSLVTSPNFVSTVATGTAPYAATSTTLNTNLNADLLDSQEGTYYLSRANHAGTQLAATISDFDTEVSNNTDVTANTAARHVAVTVTDSSTVDFTLSTQNITASVIQGGLSLINLGEKNLSSLTNAADVQAIEVLTGTYGFLKKTAENTWSIDTKSYLPLTAGSGSPLTGPLYVLNSLTHNDNAQLYGQQLITTDNVVENISTNFTYMRNFYNVFTATKDVSVTDLSRYYIVNYDINTTCDISSTDVYAMTGINNTVTNHSNNVRVWGNAVRTANYGNPYEVTEYVSRPINLAGTITDLKMFEALLTVGGQLGTITNTYGFYAGDMTEGTQTNTPYSFYASDSGAYNYFAGNTGFGVTNPTASVHLRAGTATSAPLKLTSGTNLTTPEAGALEYNGTELYFTPSSTRRTIFNSGNSNLTSVPWSASTLTLNGALSGATTIVASNSITSNYGIFNEDLGFGSGFGVNSLAFNRNFKNGAIYNSGGYAYQFQKTNSTTSTSDYLALQIYNPTGNTITNASFVINGAGNVLIGTNIDAGYKLDVAGTLRAQGAITGMSSLSINGALSGATTITASGNINTTAGDFLKNGVSINTAGTLSNVAYKNAANVFTENQVIGTASSTSSSLSLLTSNLSTYSPTINFGWAGAANAAFISLPFDTRGTDGFKIGTALSYPVSIWQNGSKIMNFVSGVATITGALTPTTTATYNLGTTSNRWNEVNTTTVNASSSVIALDYKLSALNTAPSSASDTGTTGEIRIVADFIYVCVATNTWVRTALTTW